MTLYIIGNGFDMAHHIKCKYSDFQDYLYEHYFDYYENISQGYGYSQELWTDFEKMLPSCATYIEDNGIQMGEEMLDSIDYDPMDDMGIGIWLDSQYRFLNRLPLYLRRWVESIDIIKPKMFRLQDDALFFTFNYTATLEKVYSIEPDRILHIHGFVEDKKEELIIGHCDRKTIEWAREKKQEAESVFADTNVSTYDRIIKYCEQTLKRTDLIMEIHRFFFEHIYNVDEVIVIGHSLNDVDLPYFKKIKEAINVTAHWTVYYHDPGDQKRFRKIMNNMGIPNDALKVLPSSELYLK